MRDQTRTRLRALALLAGTACPAVAIGDDAIILDPRPGVLNLRSGDVVLSARDNLLVTRAVLSPERAYLIELDGPMTPTRAAALVRARIRVGDYLPTHMFAVRSSGATIDDMARLGFVVGVYDFAPGWKLAGDIGVRAYTSGERLALAGRGEAAVAISLFAGWTAEECLGAIRRVPGLNVVSVADEGGSPCVFATLPLEQERLDALASITGVQFVDDMPEFSLRNATARWVIQSNVSNLMPFDDHGITGTGQVVGMIDGGLDVNHCSFYDNGLPPGPTHRKIIAVNSTVFADPHGTHTSGTAVGDAGNATDTRGVAWGARMVFNTYPSFNETSVFNRFNTHRTQGAAIHSNSWGNEGTTAYDITARAIDNFSWQHDDNLVLFAVSDGALIKNPENAKNCLAVSATGDTGSQENVCIGGRGPTNDARRKPEVVAPGCSIRSSRSSTACDVLAQTGTSMACPVVAGACVLMRQYFMDGFYPSGAASVTDAFTPSGALVKACVVNSAVDISGQAGFPGDREGWGRIRIDGAGYFAGDAERLIVLDVRNGAPGALSTGATRFLRFRADSGGGGPALKVTLAYHDAPAALGATFAPVNNLDLVVRGASTDPYLGNVFSGGVSSTGGTADVRNNLEQVLIPSPPTGTWTVRVNATAVNVGTQGYALVVTGDVVELCLADFNGDESLDFFDYDDFVAAFEAAAPSADFNVDGMVDFFDYDDFVAAFEMGC